MGLFDSIIIQNTNLPRPDGFIGDLPTDYQTKDLDNSLSTYFLDDWKLMFEKVEGEWIPYSEEEQKKSKWRVGEFKESSRELVPQTHYGVVNFYTGINNYDENHDAWIEFDARVNGLIVEEIKLVKFNLRDNSFRKQGENELRAQFEREENLAKSRKRFVIYPIRWVKRRLNRAIYKIGASITKIGNHIIKISFKIR